MTCMLERTYILIFEHMCQPTELTLMLHGTTPNNSVLELFQYAFMYAVALCSHEKVIQLKIKL